jgi:hypothetical protein
MKQKSPTHYTLMNFFLKLLHGKLATQSFSNTKKIFICVLLKQKQEKFMRKRRTLLKKNFNNLKDDRK